jgi:hypothetical protein
MSKNEYREATQRLLRSKSWYRSYYPWTASLLREDMKNSVSLKSGGFRVALRVTATEAIVKRYSLKRYKRDNYFIDVIG